MKDIKRTIFQAKTKAEYTNLMWVNIKLVYSAFVFAIFYTLSILVYRHFDP